MNFRILHYDQLPSTNDLALELASKDASEGTVVLTDHQTQGRGRFRKKWASRPEKDLLFSILLRPRLSPSAVPILTHFAARSVASVLEEEFSLPAKLKKPNDVLVEGKKISGILTEGSSSKNRMDYCIVGIGLNVNSRKRDLPAGATSIYLETEKKADKFSILDSILNHFWKEYSEAVIADGSHANG